MPSVLIGTLIAGGVLVAGALVHALLRELTPTHSVLVAVGSAAAGGALLLADLPIVAAMNAAAAAANLYTAQRLRRALASVSTKEVTP